MAFLNPAQIQHINPLVLLITLNLFSVASMDYNILSNKIC